jgi:Fungal specific transcription factor domain
LRSYGSCEGYPSDGTGIHTFDSNIPTVSGSQLAAQRPAAGPTFSNETEGLYFRLFIEETSLELTGVFDTTFWGQILLQESHQQDFVRHALVGIAALSKSIKTKALTVAYPGTFGTIWKEEAAKQREYALTHFGKSLRGMKAVPWAGEDYLRKISIAILLVIVFETMYGQPDLAFSHALVGDRLIRRRIDIRDRARVRMSNGQLSPAPRVLDGDIFSAFVRFGLQLMTFVDIRPYATHEVGRVNASDTMAKMPCEFFSLVEATYFWEYVVRRSCHYVMYAAVHSQSNNLMREFSKPFSGRVLDMTPETCIYGSPYIVLPKLHADKEYHTNEIGLWWSAFLPLLSHIQSSSSDLRERTGALIMQLYAITIRIVVEGTLFTDECSYDIFLPEFKDIVSLSRQIDDNFREIQENQPSFHVHLSIVPCLFTTLLRCRDRSIRRECIEILRTSQHDGPWDRFTIAKVGTWIMELEEAGSDSGYIPEHARVQFTRGMRSMETRLVMVQCVRRDRSHGWETREPRLVWEEMAMNSEGNLEWIVSDPLNDPLSGIA